MHIKTDMASNLSVLKGIAIIFFIIILPFTLYLTSCSPKSEIEKAIAKPPTLYKQGTSQEIPSSQQILVPFYQLEKNDNIQPHLSSLTVEEQAALFLSETEKTWTSPPVPFHNQTGQLYLYVDFAGQQTTRKDIAFYILPACGSANSLLFTCNLRTQSSTLYLTASTHKNTDYQTIEFNKSWRYYAHGFHQSWLFHEYDFNKQYSSSPTQQNVSFMIRANIPEGYDSKWIRLSFSDSPMTLKKTSYFVLKHHSKYYQYLWILIPLIAGLLLLYYKNFYDRSHAIIGLALCTLFSIHLMIWDIHYMVITCLLLACAGMLYSFGIWLWFWLYLAGIFVVTTYAHQYYDGLNKGFFMQTGLILLIGIGLYFTENKSSEE